MEKEENQNSTSADQNQETVKETKKPEENLAEENKQETDQEPKEEIKEPTPEEKIAELEDKVARTFAEMENQRRRFEKEKEDAFEYGGYSFAKEALNLIDNLDRSKHVLESDDKLKETEALKKALEHLDIIKKDLISIFEKNNIKPIDSLNKKLDPNFHQAMMEIEDETKEPGIRRGRARHGPASAGHHLSPHRAQHLPYPAGTGDHRLRCGDQVGSHPELSRARRDRQRQLGPDERRIHHRSDRRALHEFHRRLQLSVRAGHGLQPFLRRPAGRAGRCAGR